MRKTRSDSKKHLRCRYAHCQKRQCAKGLCHQHWKHQYVAAMTPTERRAFGRRSVGMPEPTRPEAKRCECCGKPIPVPCLDHCHKSGLFRGWLCNACNVGIGLLGDNLKGIRRAMRYLERV